MGRRAALALALLALLGALLGGLEAPGAVAAAAASDAAAEDDDLDGFGAGADDDGDDEGDGPVDAFGTQDVGLLSEPRMVITYCESRKRASVKMVVGFLEKNFPLLRGRIQIKPYPSPMYAKALKAFAIGSSVVVIFLLIFGETIFKSWYLGVPRWFRTLQHDQIRAFLLIMLIGWLGNRMLQTKAFEIDLDGERIFSGMTSGKRANTWEIAALLEELKEPRVITTLDSAQIRS